MGGVMDKPNRKIAPGCCAGSRGALSSRVVGRPVGPRCPFGFGVEQRRGVRACARQEHEPVAKPMNDTGPIEPPERVVDLDGIPSGFAHELVERPRSRSGLEKERIKDQLIDAIGVEIGIGVGWLLDVLVVVQGVGPLSMTRVTVGTPSGRVYGQYLKFC